LQNLDLAPDLLLLNRLQDLDHTSLIIYHIDSLKNLAVLSPPNLADDLVVLLISAAAISAFRYRGVAIPNEFQKKKLTPTAQQ
jgi:hypothetical protein